MYKVKDFIFKEIVTKEGIHLGEVTDIIINFHLKRLEGFKISTLSIRKKNYYVLLEDIIVIADRIIAKEKKEGKYLEFNSIKNMDILNKESNIIGVVEELLIDKDFNIKAVLATTGFLNSLFYGKKILLMNQLILGEETLLFKDNENMTFTSKVHPASESKL